MQAPELTENARIVLEKRYLRRDDQGKITETPAQLFERVAESVAEAEDPKKKGRARWADRFYELMASRRFLPNTPTLINAGRQGGQLSACFVLPVEDSLDGIFETLRQAAKIHQSGGGTGFSFTHLRPSGSAVHSTHGVASGPVSFMRIYDVSTETIKQGGARRGANMAILRVDHPDIEQFVDSKRDRKSILNFNISVGATDEFMFAALADSAFSLRDPRDGKPMREIRARALFDRIAQAAWECGDPGLVFLDRINFFNPTPQIGEMQSTNPCGEQPLLPYESCNLGSLNLGLYAPAGVFDWNLFRGDVRAAVRFLDDVIDVNEFPVAESRRITLNNRKIGLGVMGFADLLLALGIPYDAPEARKLGELVMSVLDREAKLCSVELARERGAFGNWRRSLWQQLGYPPMRNATVSTVAPTGTISIIAGASSGIEPYFSAEFTRNVLSGARLKEKLPGADSAAWRSALDVSIDDHVRMQAAFQRHADAAVSKTINLPERASVADVAHAYRLAFTLGCKGITIYRDRSRDEQVLDREGAAAESCEDC